MTAPRTAAAILAERLSVVLAIGEANGAHQRAQAGVSGARIEAMTLEDRPSAGAEAVAAAEARLGAAADRIAALDARLAELDRELAAGGG